MGRILKILGIVVGAVVVLFIGALVAIAVLVDPNDYKDQITTAVNDATGRTLTLEGDLGLNLFPRLGISMGAAELSNADGFGNEPFARIESAELRVGLLPLLSRRVEVDRANLSGLRLNLARAASGTTNWDDLARDGAAPAAAADDADAAGAGVDISVGAVEIADAEVTWQDVAAGQNWRLSDLNLTASGFDPGNAFPVEVGFALAGDQVTVVVDAQLNARVTLADQNYQLTELDIRIDGEGPGWPGGSGEARLAFNTLEADLDEQTVFLEQLQLEMLGMNITGNLNGQDLLDDLSLEGGITIDEFDPRELMSVFGAEIETADPDVLRKSSASAGFYFSSAGMGMRDMALRLDDSNLQGSAGIAGERFEFDLNVDAINIDRYLPPADDAAAADEGSVDEVDLPIEPLRSFNARGNLALGEAQFLGLTFNDANFALNAGNGRMTLTPTGGLYDGTIDGEISIAVQGDAAQLGLRTDISGVGMAGLVRDYMQMEAIEGTGSVQLDLAATGSKVGEIKQGLDGSASVVVTNGALLGVDIWQLMQEGRAALTGPDAPAADPNPRTPFSRIAVVGPVEDALLTTSEFAAAMSFAAITGQGTLQLLTTELDIRAQAGLLDGETLQQDPVLSQAAGFNFPLRITGTLDAPSVLPDFSGLAGMLGAAARQAVSEEVNEAREEAEAEVREELDEAADSLRDRLRDRLD